MTKEQIESYEKCKVYLSHHSTWRQKNPVKSQHFGMTNSIEVSIEKIHQEMYQKIIEAFDDAEEKVNNIINSL